MKALIADQKLVTELLPMDDAIAVMRRALTLLAEGDVVMPLRNIMVMPGAERVMSLMPSYLGGLGAFGVKVVAAFPANFGTEYDTHQGVVLLFDTERGLLRAIVDATSITAIRTAAVSGLVTDLLAKPGAGDVAIIGAGTQAHTHLQAMMAVRPVRRVRVYSLPAESAVAFAERESRLTGMQVEVAASAEEAVAGADLICTTTTATDPVVSGDWVSPGAHINAVGAYTPATRELDSALVVRSRLYADWRESLLNEAGEFLIPKGEGLIGDDHIVAEIGEVLTGKAAARTSPDPGDPLQVTRHRHRGPRRGASRVRQGQGERRWHLDRDRWPSLRQLSGFRRWGVSKATIRVWDAEECERVHQASLTVLAQCGVEVLYEPALKRFAAAGARVEGTRVRSPKEMVAEALESAPRTWMVRSRGRDEVLHLRDGETYFGTGSHGLHH